MEKKKIDRIVSMFNEKKDSVFFEKLMDFLNDEVFNEIHELNKIERKTRITKEFIRPDLTTNLSISLWIKTKQNDYGEFSISFIQNQKWISIEQIEKYAKKQIQILSDYRAEESLIDYSTENYLNYTTIRIYCSGILENREGTYYLNSEIKKKNEILFNRLDFIK